MKVLWLKYNMMNVIFTTIFRKSLKFYLALQVYSKEDELKKKLKQIQDAFQLHFIAFYNLVFQLDKTLAKKFLLN
jgi:hypothetical protein